MIMIMIINIITINIIMREDTHLIITLSQSVAMSISMVYN